MLDTNVRRNNLILCYAVFFLQAVEVELKAVHRHYSPVENPLWWLNIFPLAAKHLHIFACLFVMDGLAVQSLHSPSWIVHLLWECEVQHENAWYLCSCLGPQCEMRAGGERSTVFFRGEWRRFSVVQYKHFKPFCHLYCVWCKWPCVHFANIRYFTSHLCVRSSLVVSMLVSWILLTGWT